MFWKRRVYIFFIFVFEVIRMSIGYMNVNLEKIEKEN